MKPIKFQASIFASIKTSAYLSKDGVCVVSKAPSTSTVDDESDTEEDVVGRAGAAESDLLRTGAVELEDEEAFSGRPVRLIAGVVDVVEVEEMGATRRCAGAIDASEDT